MRVILLSTLLAAAFSQESSAVLQTNPSLSVQLYAGLTITGTVGSTYLVQYETALTPTSNTWQTLTNLTLTSSPYLWVDTSSPATGQRFYRLAAPPASNAPVVPAGMALVSAGTFVMGDSVDGESDAPPGTVTVSGFFIDTNLVSGGLWQEVYTNAINSGYSFDVTFLIENGVPVARGDNFPAESIDWFDAVAWCNARSQQAGLSPVYYTDPGLTQVFMGGDVAVYVNWATNGYRLPTEAEWEKAARGGLVGQRFPLGSTISETNANYRADPYNASLNTGFSYDKGPAGPNIWATNPTGAETSTVGYYAPNGYGLYDMAGNVGQWCWDWYGASYYTNFPLTDPQGPASGTERVVRNGGFNNTAFQCRTANRSDLPASDYDNNVGFRTVLAESP